MNMLGGAIIDNILTNFIVGSQQWKYKAILSLFLFLNLVLTKYMIYGILNMSKDGRVLFHFYLSPICYSQIYAFTICKSDD